MNFKINNKKEPIKDFARIASDLMNYHVLIVGNQTYRFTTLEFYYFDKENHPDIYSHQHPLQKTTGKWYFHGSGLDITFGNNDTHGGILIRGIKNLQEKTFINGPLNCVQELFSNLGDVINDKGIEFFIADITHEKIGALIEDQKVYQSKRVGLNENNDKLPDLKFYNGLYRFFINPEKTQKDKGKIALDLLRQGMTEAEVNKFVGYNFFKKSQ